MSKLTFACLVLVGCGGLSAESPLDVRPGLSRDAAIARLHKFEYCRKDEPPAKIENYPRCERPGLEWGASWVEATYDHDQLVQLRRWERFADDNRALERWNQLITDRAKSTPESKEARQALLDKADLPAGTQSWVAFRLDDDTVVGVYYLTPTPPENAQVLEQIVASSIAGIGAE